MKLAEDNNGSKNSLPFGSSLFKAEMGKGEAKVSPFQQMLSFSASKEESLGASADGSLPSLLLSSSRSLWEAEDLGYGALSGTKMLFTPVQWMELQRQVMIFRYIDAKTPIPSHLLNSFGDAHNPTVYPGYSVGSLRNTASAYGWDSIQLVSPSIKDTDPERCRRTDGKKWRCSNNSAPNHRYCEKHMNRGRHRSRKPVEGRNGHTKVVPPAAPSPALSVASGGGSGDTLTDHPEQQMLSWQPDSACAISNQLKRAKNENASNWMMDSLPGFLNSSGLARVRAACGVKQENLLEESSSLREGTPQNINFDNIIQASSHQAPKVPLHYFAGEERNPEHINFSNPQALSSEISSSSSSPTEEKDNYMAPQELGLTEVSNAVENNKDPNGTSASPVPSFGGPLGEVLNKGYNNESSNGSSPLNFLSDCWDSDTMARFVTNLTSVDDLWLLT